jgi:hypothetical protein
MYVYVYVYVPPHVSPLHIEYDSLSPSTSEFEYMYVSCLKDLAVFLFDLVGIHCLFNHRTNKPKNSLAFELKL